LIVADQGLGQGERRVERPLASGAPWPIGLPETDVIWLAFVIVEVCWEAGSPVPKGTSTRCLTTIHEEKQMYLGGGLLGTVLIVLLILFLLGRI
jgi:hypothetical protein